MNQEFSSQSIDKGYLVNEYSKEENSRVNTSINYFDQSNYFNSMLSGKGFSKIDFDDDKWLKKSTGRYSLEESFEQDTVLPEGLADKFNILIEKETKQVLLEESDDELLSDSPNKKFLERGKEMVRKSGYGVDFSGKLISKGSLISTFEEFKPLSKNTISLASENSQKNKLYTEKEKTKKPGIYNNLNHPENKKQKKSFKKSLEDSNNYIQGITSTKYSDIYCQENLESSLIPRFDYNSKSDLNNDSIEGFIQNKIINKESSEKEGKLKRENKFEENEIKEHIPFVKDKSLAEKNKQTTSNLQNPECKKNLNKCPVDSFDRSSNNFFDNGSFLNMKDNNSIMMDTESISPSIINSIEK
jgi:hypothetical protein